MPKSQPLKRVQEAPNGVFRRTNSDAKEPTTETTGGGHELWADKVPIQMPKSQPLKLSIHVERTSHRSTNSDAKEPTTETNKRQHAPCQIRRTNSDAKEPTTETAE